MPAGETRHRRAEECPRRRRGEVTVIARLRPSEPASTTGTPPPARSPGSTCPPSARGLPYPVYGGYGELTREQPQPRARPGRLLPPPELSEGPHLAYAVQWFLFACMALGGYVVLARREAADRQAAADGPAPVVAVRVPG